MAEILLPRRFKGQPQYAAPLDKRHPLAKDITLFLNGAVPQFNAATGKPLAITAGGSGFSRRATPLGMALYTPNGGWADVAVGQDWAEPNTLIALCRLNGIDTWGGLFSKDSSGTDTQFAVGQWDASGSLYGAVENAASATFGGGTISALAGGFSVLAFTHSGAYATTMSYYRNGVPVGSTTGLGTQNTGAGVLGLGRSRDASASFDADVDWLAFVRVARVLSASEIASITSSPAAIWSLLQAPARRLWAASASGITLVGASSTEANTSSTGAITQAHALTGANSTQANTGSSGAVTQTHILVGANSTQGNSASTGSITQSGVFVGDNCAQANESSTGGITQTHVLTATNSSQANTASTGAISQGAVNDLAAASATQANSGGAGAITQAHVLVHAPSVQDNIAGASAIVQAHVLAASNCSQVNAASSAALISDTISARRTYTVPTENREYRVPAESRTYTVPL